MGVARRTLTILTVLAALLGVNARVAGASITVPAGTPTTFTGSGAPGAANALAGFEAASGGADNGVTAGEQGSGFRHVTWDGVALDGSAPDSTVITSGHVAAVARDRLQPWGIELGPPGNQQGPEIAVANDGFQSVNGSVAGRFTPFSAPNVWAPFNSVTADMQIVAPAAQTVTPAPALTRGLGIVFLNVRSANTTEIQYYNDEALLGQVFAPAGSTSFAGLLFPGPVVTRVVVTLGNAEIFGFDGSTVTSGPADSGTTNLVAADDVVLAEPGPARPPVAATAGVPLAPVLDTFTDTDPSSIPGDFTATIDWGDGTRSAGTIASGPGGTFVVTGSHAYSEAGNYTAEVTVADFATPSTSPPEPTEQTSDTLIQVAPRDSATTVSCSPSRVAVSAATICTATVSDADAGGGIAPTGTVAFSSPTAGASFADDAGCVLGSIGVPGVSACQVAFIPNQFPPRQARLAAAYSGDAAHGSSAATAIVGVRAQRCTLRPLSKRLVHHPPGLAVIVTCDARANVLIAGKAAAGHGGHKQARFSFGTIKALVTPGRPTVLVVRASSAARAALRAAKLRHQRVTVKLILTASSHATRTTTTTRVSSVRLY